MQRRQRQIQPTDLKAKAVGIVVRELRKQAGHSQDEESGRRRSRFRSQTDHDSGGKPITRSGAKPISDSGLKAISNRPPAEW